MMASISLSYSRDAVMSFDLVKSKVTFPCAPSASLSFFFFGILMIQKIILTMSVYSSSREA